MALAEHRHIDIDLLKRGKYQPRIDFGDLQELSDSIKAQGVIQPIVVRPAGAGFEILAGERRWRAAQLAGQHKVPCLVRVDLQDPQAAAISLIENVQRKDLNAMEEAEALGRLVEEFGFDHAEVAEMIGVSRTTVTNRLRLLKLNPTAQRLIREGKLNEGHGKVLAGIAGADQDRLAVLAADHNYSVRQIEARARRVHAGTALSSTATKKDPDIASMETRVSESIGCPVTIQSTDAGGWNLSLNSFSLDEFEGVLERLLRRPSEISRSGK
jgi:ParB family chromosome partitioning protein